MTPLHELLSRIRWDADFGAARFELGYYDRVADRIVRVDLRDLSFDAANRAIRPRRRRRPTSQHSAAPREGSLAERPLDLATRLSRERVTCPRRHDDCPSDGP